MMIARYLQWIAIIFLVGCASLQPTMEAPQLRVSSFRILPSSSLNPKFEIGLHVTNPNSRSLKLKGLVYTAIIEGHKILSGVANKLPEIPAYGEDEVVLTANADLISGFRLLTDLMQNQRQDVRYLLRLKLDVGTFMPAITVDTEGILQ